MFHFKKTKLRRQHLYYLLLVLLAVLLGITLLNTITDKQRLVEEQERQRVQEEKKHLETETALAELELAHTYQPRCTDGARQIQRAGDYLKLVFEIPQPRTRYYLDEREFTCAKTTKSADCEAVRQMVFEIIYVCGAESLSTAVTARAGIQITAQEPGNAVVIERVILEQPGFVAVHSLDRAGALGERLAQSLLLPQGLSEIVSIAIPKSLLLTQRYAVALYVDNGNGVFDAENDALVGSDVNEPLIAPFNVAKKP